MRSVFRDTTIENDTTIHDSSVLRQSVVILVYWKL